MFNPLKLLKPVVKVVSLFLPINELVDKHDNPAPTSSPEMSKMWRPLTAISFLLMIVVSFFTSYSIPEDLLILMGVFLTVLAGGRSWEKAIPMVMEILMKREEGKEG